MAKPKHANHYQPAGGAHARRDFLFRNVWYLRGEVFPFTALAMPPIKVVMLWRAQRIAYGTAPDEWQVEATYRRRGLVFSPTGEPVPAAPPDAIIIAKPPRRQRRERATASEEDGNDAEEDPAE